MMSSASATRCFFQDICEKNYKNEIDNETYASKSLNWGDKGFEIVSTTLFVRHFKSMISENYNYVSGVESMLNSCNGDENAPEFLSQYHNIFSNKVASDFYNIPLLIERGIFNPIEKYKYINNVKYVLLAGVDCASSGEDASTLTIKAFENKIGIDRDSWIIEKICLNPNRDPIGESIYEQMKIVARYIIDYKISGVAIDITGIGSGAHGYLEQHLKNMRADGFNYKYIMPVYFAPKLRHDILENYHNRIQSAKENFGKLPFTEIDDEWMKKQYFTSYFKYSPIDMDIKFCFEHYSFARIEETNEKGDKKITYTTAGSRKIHDDTVFSSALASYLIIEYPNIMKTVRVKQPEQNRYNSFDKRVFWTR